MLPGPSNPIDQDMLQVEDNRRPRNVSNVVYDNQKVPRQNSETTVLSQRLVDAQINSATSNSNSVDTPPKQQNRTVSPVVEIEPDLSHEISTTDNNVADNYLVSDLKVLIIFSFKFISSVSQLGSKQKRLYLQWYSLNTIRN